MGGQLGRDKATSQPSPISFTHRTSGDEVRRSGVVRHEGATSDWESIQPKIILVEAGGMMSCAVDIDGALWLWGAVSNPSDYSDNHSSRDMSYRAINIESPERVRGLSGLRVYRVALGNEHIVALVEGRDEIDLDCYAWGNNQFGQLGLGDFRDRPYPQVVKYLAASVVGSIVDLACGAFHTAILAVKDDNPTDLILEPNSPRSRRNKQGWDVIQDSPTPRHSFFRTHQSMVDQLEHNRNSPNVRTRQDSVTSSSLRSTAWGSSRVSSSRNLTQCASTRSKESFCLEGRLSVCWTFGQGENGQLGQGTTVNQSYPAPVEGLPNERLRTVACGLFHTAVVTEIGDVWVWGMEGGLGLCAGIGPPGSRSGDALSPVRVFGDSSANCHPVTGSKGITCGAAHTVTMSDGGRDIWAWERGQRGVLGSGHTSDSWFPCPVVWPPETPVVHWTAGSQGPNHSDALYPMGFDCRRLSRASTRTSSRDTGHFEKCPPQAADSDSRKLSGVQSHDNSSRSGKIKALQKELAEARRHAESLHAAIYGEVEGVVQEDAFHDWERRMEAASADDLANLDHYYRSMGVRLKQISFQRKMDEWCCRCMTAMNSPGAPAGSQSTRESYSAANTPFRDGPGELAMNKIGL
uniref:Uncharacterized protein n=1 Tax=Physcomitrium patens TaxID=3218 RepID=A0A2K1L8E9_PHYPA|nr:hypothetical protein PHYPA_000734 [Physcomitrium patens]